MPDEKRKPGRPPKPPGEKVQSQHLRFTPNEVATIKRAATITGETPYRFMQVAAIARAKAVLEGEGK